MPGKDHLHDSSWWHVLSPNKHLKTGQDEAIFCWPLADTCTHNSSMIQVACMTLAQVSLTLSRRRCFCSESHPWRILEHPALVLQPGLSLLDYITVTLYLTLKSFLVLEPGVTCRKWLAGRPPAVADRCPKGIYTGPVTARVIDSMSPPEGEREIPIPYIQPVMACEDESQRQMGWIN